MADALLHCRLEHRWLAAVGGKSDRAVWRLVAGRAPVRSPGTTRLSDLVLLCAAGGERLNVGTVERGADGFDACNTRGDRLHCAHASAALAQDWLEAHGFVVAELPS